MKKNQRQRAAVLAYEHEGEDAPTVLVTSEHLSADAIIDIARQYGIPVVERSLLSQALSSLAIDQSIPPELYEAVAAVLLELERDEEVHH